MTRDELLQQLKEMSSSLTYDSATKITADSRDEEVKSIEEQRELLSFQIKELEARLADDNNYSSFTLFRNQARIYDLNSKISKINSDIVQNEADMTECEQRISHINSEIEACNALLSESQNDLEQYSSELRSLGENPDPIKEQEVLRKLASAREDIDWLKSEFAILSTELEDSNTTKKDLLQRKDNLESSQERYQKLLTSVKEREAKDSETKIDTAKKEADQRKLLQLRSVVESFNNREAYVSFDLPIELETLISDIENNRIDDETILRCLQEFKVLLPSQLANKDYSNADEELKENQRLQAEILMEKGALESKLADEDNYLPSIFAVEAMNQEISSLEQTIARYDVDIKNSDANLARYDSVKSNLDADIEKAEKEREGLEQDLADLRLKEAILPTAIYDEQKDEINREKKKIKKEIDEIDKRIERLTKTSLSTDLSTVLIKRDRKNLEVLRNNEIKALEAKKKTLEERKGIDKMAMAADKEKLAALSAQLTILKMREKSIYYDYEENLDKLISEFQPSVKKEDNQTVIPVAPLSLDDEEKSNDSEEIIAPIDLSKEADSTSLEPIPPISSDNDEVVAEEAETTKDDDEPIPIAFFKKAKDSLLAKIHDKAFMKRVKAAALAALVALMMGLGLAKCGADNQATLTAPNQIVDIVDTPELPEVDIDNIEIEEPVVETPSKSIDELAMEVINGQWGNGQEREDALTDAGYDYDEVQDKVNEILGNQDQNNTGTDVNPEPEPEPEPEPTPEPEPEPTPEPEPEPTPEPEHNSTEIFTPNESITISGYEDTNGDNSAIVVDNLDSDGELTPEEERLQQEAENVLDYIKDQNVDVGTVDDNDDVIEHTYGDDGTTTTVEVSQDNEPDKSIADMIKDYYGVDNQATNEQGGKTR